MAAAVTREVPPSARERAPVVVRHPLFARMYDRLSRTAEETEQADHRRDLLAGLTGRVIEVGAGNGLNFRYYPTTAGEVVAVEPEAFLRERAEEAAREAPVAVRVLAGPAEALPVETASFDCGIASLVLCSVQDLRVALAELMRVVRPGGELRFYEHVRSEQPRLARAQVLADRTFWPHIGGGCHASRRTVAAIEAAGFEIEMCERFTFKPFRFATLTSPHVIGVARRPAEGPR
jgi:ubiquinone/menaquinone biosynthesis C-methylase UbiE